MVADKNNPNNVPYIVFEGEMSRMERIIKRLWIAVIILAAVIAVSVIGFVWYESQYETMSYQQDGAGINNVNVGSQGDIYGSESADKEKEIGDTES